jgi:hypothetical protein
MTGLKHDSVIGTNDFFYKPSFLSRFRIGEAAYSTRRDVTGRRHTAFYNLQE